MEYKIEPVSTILHHEIAEIKGGKVGTLATFIVMVA